MKTYSRSAFKLIMDLFWALVGMAVFTAIGYFIFPKYDLYIFIASGIITILLIFHIIFKNNIKITLDGDVLCYYENNKLLHEINVKGRYINYSMKTTNNSVDTLYLIIDDLSLDCEPIGKNKFFNLYAELEAISPQVTKLN